MNNLLSVKHPLNSLVGGGNLLRHRQTTHEVSKYCCGDCGKNLNRKDNLQSYTLSVHKESNEFRCNCVILNIIYRTTLKDTRGLLTLMMFAKTLM